MTIPQIGQPKPAKEPASSDQVLRIAAFVLVVWPTAVSLNILMWVVTANLWGVR